MVFGSITLRGDTGRALETFGTHSPRAALPQNPHMQLLQRFARGEPNVILKSWIGVVSYLLGSASGWWVAMPLAYVFYALTPLFFIVPPSRRST